MARIQCRRDILVDPGDSTERSRRDYVMRVDTPGRQRIDLHQVGHEYPQVENSDYPDCRTRHGGIPLGG